jgi:hypothetical protein
MRVKLQNVQQNSFRRRKHAGLRVQERSMARDVARTATLL